MVLLTSSWYGLSIMPGLQRQSVLDAVRSSCEASLSSSCTVRLVPARLSELASQLQAADVKEAPKGVVFPVKFDDMESEVNLLALHRLLNFGSGYAPALQRQVQRSADDAMLYGVLGMQLGAPRLDAAYLASFSHFSVNTFFGLDARVERELMPGIMQLVPGPLAPLVDSIVSVVSETGRRVQEAGHRSLGALVVALLRSQGGSEGSPPQASVFIRDLVDVLQVFDDSAVADEAGGACWQWQRRAQLLAADIWGRWGASCAPLCGFSDVDRLTGDSGAELAAVLRRLGVLELEEELAARIDAQQELPPGRDERALRAAAVVAVDRLAAAVGGGVTPYDVSAYLLQPSAPGQGPARQHTPPHLTPGITAY